MERTEEEPNRGREIGFIGELHPVIYDEICGGFLVTEQEDPEQK